MSARNPLTIIRKQILALHRTAYHIKKLRVRKEEAEYIYKELKETLSPKLLDQAWLYTIEQFIASKLEQTDFGAENLNLWVDYDDIYFATKVEGNAGQIVLGDVDETSMPAIIRARESNVEAATKALAQLRIAWKRVQPLLAANPGWKWRDAVKWMEGHGGVPEL
jgi:hypothetical protein